MYSPKLDDFLKLAAQGNVISVTCRLLADIETPLSAYRKIRGQGESFLFESVEGGEHLGRYSFVGCNPRAVIKQTGDRVEVIENGKVVETFCRWKASGLSFASRPKLRGVNVTPRNSAGAESGQATPVHQHVEDGLVVVERLMKKYHGVSMPGLPRFTGGAIGFIGYEFIHDIEPVVPRPPKDELGTPTMVFLIADQLLIFDRVAQTITVLVNAFLDDAINPTEAYEDAVAEVERLVSLLEQPSEHNPVSVPDIMPAAAFESNMPKEKFSRNVLKAKEYITAGDIIQVVGSQRFSAPAKASRH